MRVAGKYGLVRRDLSSSLRVPNHRRGSGIRCSASPKIPHLNTRALISGSFPDLLKREYPRFSVICQICMPGDRDLGSLINKLLPDFRPEQSPLILYVEDFHYAQCCQFIHRVITSEHQPSFSEIQDIRAKIQRICNLFSQMHGIEIHDPKNLGDEFLNTILIAAQFYYTNAFLFWLEQTKPADYLIDCPPNDFKLPQGSIALEELLVTLKIKRKQRIKRYHEFLISSLIQGKPTGDLSFQDLNEYVAFVKKIARPFYK